MTDEMKLALELSMQKKDNLSELLVFDWLVFFGLDCFVVASTKQHELDASGLSTLCTWLK